MEAAQDLFIFGVIWYCTKWIQQLDINHEPNIELDGRLGLVIGRWGGLHMFPQRNYTEIARPTFIKILNPSYSTVSKIHWNTNYSKTNQERQDNQVRKNLKEILKHFEHVRKSLKKSQISLWESPNSESSKESTLETLNKSEKVSKSLDQVSNRFENVSIKSGSLKRAEKSRYTYVI